MGIAISIIAMMAAVNPGLTSASIGGIQNGSFESRTSVTRIAEVAERGKQRATSSDSPLDVFPYPLNREVRVDFMAGRSGSRPDERDSKADRYYGDARVIREERSITLRLNLRGLSERDCPCYLYAVDNDGNALLIDKLMTRGGQAYLDTETDFPAEEFESGFILVVSTDRTLRRVTRATPLLLQGMSPR